MFQSPWLYQLQRRRPVHRLTEYQRTDVVIVGGGISGVVTAYHILRETQYRVVIIDAHRVGHGASGKNAGYMLADIERPHKELVEVFGEDVVKRGLKALESSWDILDRMRGDLGLATPIFPCSGHYGFASIEAFLTELENAYWRREAGVTVVPFGVSRSSGWEARISSRYDGLWKLIDVEEIPPLLEHEDPSFQAVGYRRMACGNSALLSEEIVQSLLARFGPRFSVYEDTHVTEVTCGRQGAHVRTGSIAVDARWVVLCTNGFEQFHVKDEDGASLDPKFHTLVQGEVAYMEGFLHDKPQSAQGYIYLNTDKPSETPYVYVSRRPFEFDAKPKTLVCVGGPEYILPDTSDYDPFHPFPKHAETEVDRFLAGGQKVIPKQADRVFRWHGLMGYTPNRVRCIGFEPCQPSLLYNLGCNGIGLMPSMYGGWKIAQLLVDKDDGVRLFDPQDRRCILPS